VAARHPEIAMLQHVGCKTMEKNFFFFFRFLMAGPGVVRPTPHGKTSKRYQNVAFEILSVAG